MFRTYVSVIALAVSASARPALAQDPAPTEGAGWTGVTEPEEVIEARRVLMIELERQMNPIDRFTLGEPADLAALKSAAVTMEALLLAFPHLFPPTTDRFDPTVRESPTIALPEIWRDFDSFLTMAGAAEAAVAAIASADGAEALRAAGRNLRATCDTCHARFTRPYTPPKVTEEDLNFDFEAVLPRD
jgi:cytochrome c556